jgi:hypothetical protein
MAQTEKLDEELRRILDTTGQKNPLPMEQLSQLKPVQAFAWPWQVPQAPSYTSDRGQ